MEWATPTLPDLTINLKQCSVQPRSLKDPESTVWICWFLASRLDLTGANGGGRLKHAPQILWKQNRDVLSLILVSIWQLSSHLSHFLCHGLLQNPEVNWAEHHRDADISLSSPHTKYHGANSQTMSSKQSWTGRALHLRQLQLGVRGTRHWRCHRVERKGQCWFCCAPGTPYAIFSHMWKNVDSSVYLIGGTSNSPQEHPIFFCFF